MAKLEVDFSLKRCWGLCNSIKIGKNFKINCTCGSRDQVHVHLSLKIPMTKAAVKGLMCVKRLRKPCVLTRLFSQCKLCQTATREPSTLREASLAYS